jgi:hypothetical protein
MLQNFTKIRAGKNQKFLKLFLLFFFVAGALFLVAPQEARAAFGLGKIGDALAFLPSLALSLLLRIILLAGEGILRFTNYILSWIISNPFHLSFTNPADNPIIKVGWTMLRDISNMFLVLGLAWIGLATALNIAGFQTKKVFLNLLVVALFINFTPVFIGFFVDIANILGNFFLKGVNFEDVVNNYQAQRIAVANSGTKLLSDPAVLMNAIFLIAYGVLGGLIFLVFALLFFFRYVAMWLITIFSPTAFVAWVFPQTKSLYQRWLHWFTSWTFLIVPASFVLYISQHILANLDKFSDYSGDPTGGFFPAVAPFLVALLFLVIGAYLAIKVTAPAASAIIGMGASFGTKLLAGGGKLLKRGAVAGGRAIANRLPQAKKPGEEGYEELKGKQKILSRAARIGRFVTGSLTETEKEMLKKKYGKVGGGIIARAPRVAAGLLTLGATYWTKPLTRTVQSKVVESTEKTISSAKQQIAHKPIETQRRLFKNTKIGTEKKIGYLEQIAEEGNIDKVGITDAEIESLLRKAASIHPDAVSRTLKFINPEITQRVAKGLPKRLLEKTGLLLTDEDRAEGYKDLSAKIRAELTPSKMKFMKKDALLAAAESEEAHKFWTGSHISKGGELLGAAFLDKIQSGIEKITGTKDVKEQEEWYAKNNPRLRRYFNSSPARALGVGFGTAPEKKVLPPEEIIRMKAEGGYVQKWEGLKNKAKFLKESLETLHNRLAELTKAYEEAPYDEELITKIHSVEQLIDELKEEQAKLSEEKGKKWTRWTKWTKKKKRPDTGTSTKK